MKKGQNKNISSFENKKNNFIMKKIAVLLILLICLLVGGYYYVLSKNTILSPLSGVLPSPMPTTAVVQKASESLFVPYWSFSSKDIDTADFDSVIYFGVSANTKGIDTTDSGYTKLAQFNELVPTNTEKFLTVRMINSVINSKVLDDKKLQGKIIKESIDIAKKHDFSGIVFDFEINALAFPSVVENITQFYKTFYTQSKKNNLSFHITLYGDTVYRARPYNVGEISHYADKILIMTYDYHKSRGNPGPNFPLSGKDTYGYDIDSMLIDFSKDVSMEKLVIVFGLFGYDWEVDGKKESVTNGVPLSFLEIKRNFIDRCSEKDCRIKQDSLSGETKITYTDADGKQHIIWFEDETSVAKKKEFLASKGINATSIWAYSYY